MRSFVEDRLTPVLALACAIVVFVAAAIDLHTPAARGTPWRVAPAGAHGYAPPPPRPFRSTATWRC
jgi:hypothetical protein